MNHIFFCINDDWIKQCGITIKSIQIYNHQMDFTFHILGKEINENNKKLLSEVIEKNNSIVFNTLTNEYDSQFIIRPGDHISVETYYRFFIPNFLDDNIKKALYIDADILCTGSLKELLETDLSGFACGMILDMDYSDISKYNRLDYDFSDKYFNGGVLLVNLDYWRKENTTKKLIDFVCNNPNKCLLHDQDALNSTLHGKIKRLDFKYDMQNTLFRLPFWADETNPQFYDDEKIEKKYWNEIQHALEAPVFIHFTGSYKPWHKECNIPFTNLWREIYSTVSYSSKVKPKPKNLKELIKFTILKFAVKANFKKEMPHLCTYPQSVYTIEEDYIRKFRQEKKIGIIQ